MTKEALTQLREVHAIQGRDGCWDIDDYMLGLYNGLELALSIVENRACKYKQRPKSQPEQEPVAWGVFEGNLHDMFFTEAEAVEMTQLKGNHAEVKPLYTAPQRTWVGLTDEEIKAFDTWHDNREEEVGWCNPSEIVAYIEAKLKEKTLDKPDL